MLSRKQSSTIFLSFLIGCSTVLSPAMFVPAMAETTDSSAQMSVDPCGAVEKIVREFYPRAIINKGRGEITFEFRAHKKNGFYPDRAAMVPGEGGIVGTVTLSPGEYAESDKSDIPSERPNGFYSVLTMAPFSKRQNSHLLAKVIFPQEVPANFKEKFKSLINSFNAADRAAEEAAKNPAPEVVAASTTPSVDAEPPKAKSNYAWATVARPDYRLSFKAPSGFKAKDSADKAGTTWTGTADGVDFTVTVYKPNTALITDDQRTQTMNAMVSNFCKGKKSKMEQAMRFQGLSAQEYSVTDPSGASSKIICCVSVALQYMFAAGGKNYKASKLPPEFFDAIRIGSIK